MSRIASLGLGWLAIIGSVIGLWSMVPLLLQGGRMRFPGELVLFLSTALYGYGIWTGVQAVRLRPNWPRHARWFWLAQVPTFASPAFSFFISCAAGVWLYLRWGASGIGAGGSALVGSGLHWSYERGGPDFIVGVNVLAASFAVLLFRWPKIRPLSEQ